jgi:hypothetical protein
MNDSQVPPVNDPVPAPLNDEQEQLKIEERKVRIDEEHLEIDRQRLQVDREKAVSERKYKNFPTIATTAVSIAAIAVSVAQVWVAYISKNKEMQIAELQNDRVWKLEVFKFVTEHEKEIFGGTSDQQQHLGDVIRITFPRDISDALLKKLEPTHSAAKSAAPNPWAEARQELKQTDNEAHVFFTVTNKNGERLQQVHVRFINALNETGPYDAMTGNDGTGIIDLPVSNAGANFRVLVTRNGYEPQNDTLGFMPGNHGVSFTIDPIPPS